MWPPGFHQRELSEPNDDSIQDEYIKSENIVSEATEGDDFH
jgi:hypothetical protein